MKKYLQQLIGTEFKKWAGRKVLIEAPTGMGKTTFIINSLLPYLRERGKKLLVLCNRKLLRLQYWFALVEKYDDFDELQDSITIMTYQQLSARVRNMDCWDGLFNDYQVVVCDEAHYFYADADFNGFGTYALLHAIVYAGIGKSMIFLSATMDEVRPLITTTIRNCWTKFSRQKPDWRLDETCKEIIDLDFSMYADFDRFQCFCIPDEENLCEILAESEKNQSFLLTTGRKGQSLRSGF